MPFVDTCIVIDTAGSEETIAAARAVCPDKLVVDHWSWQNDFAAARNHALSCAQSLGFDWAITCDTDERIVLNGEDVRGFLETCTFDSVGMQHSGRTYNKTRAIRLPAKSVWVEATHECFPIANSSVFEKAVFDELPKTAEQLAFKFKRDVEILKAAIEKNPKNQRAWYYLGASWHDAQKYQNAIDAFVACSKLDGWPEERSRAMYRAAECSCCLENYDQALTFCAISLALFAAMAESAWLAGYACSKLGRGQDAYAWAKMSESLGYYAGVGEHLSRGGFKTLNALFEGPYDLMRFHAPTLEWQQEADIQYKLAIEARNAGR
jgi:tetratricopeptide (TPR) repeat protein